MGGGERSVRAEGQVLLNHTFFFILPQTRSTKTKQCLYKRLYTGQLTEITFS